MKAIVYSTSWCANCKDMVDFLKREYPDLSIQFFALDRRSQEQRDKALAAIQKLTWSKRLPVTLLDDTVILGTDYMALIAFLGRPAESPPRGNYEHRHGLDEDEAQDTT